jgi:hypothetical protein
MQVTPDGQSMAGTQKLFAVIGISVFGLAGCFVQRRVVVAPAARPRRPPPTATKEELIRRVHEVFDPIDSFLMKVNMAPSTGSEFKGVITDYATIGAYILYERPDKLRIIGQDPLMGSTIFDMVSRGREFRLYIPSKRRFIVGDNDAPAKSKNDLENMRPVAFLTALLVNPPDPETEITLLEDGANQNAAVYILLMIRRDGEQYRLVRNITFDAYTLQIGGQNTFGSSGRIIRTGRAMDRYRFRQRLISSGQRRITKSG